MTPAVTTVSETVPSSGLNPHTGTLAEHIADLIARTGLRRWQEARFELLLCRMYPTAELPLLRTAAAATLWLFLVDEHLDPGGPGDDPDYSGWFAAEMETLSSRTRTTDPLLRAAQALLDEAEPAPEVWRRRFRGHLRDFAAAMHREVVERAAGHSPPIARYVEARRVTSGWAILTDFAERPDAESGVLSTSAYQRLRQAAGDVTFGVNDLLSLEREMAAGERHNLVLIARTEHGGSLESARRWADDWVAVRLRDYLTARAELRPAGGLADDRIAAVDALVRGTLDWSRETGRYWAPGPGERSDRDGEDGAEALGHGARP